MNLKQARATERRYHDAVADATLRVLVTTQAEREYYEAELEIAWLYGEQTPFQAACEARRAGDERSWRRALADDRHLHTLAEAAG